MSARPIAAAVTVCIVTLLAAAPVRAQDPFGLDAQTTTGTPATITTSGSSMVDLVRNLIQSQADFSGFSGQAFTASLDYGRINDAIQFQRNAAGTSATVSIPSTGFSRTFTGSNEAEVYDAIKDFLIRDGAEEYARFLQRVNEQSLLGVTDGNPQAATALLSNSAFFKFGLQRSPLDAGSLAEVTPSGSGLRFDLHGGLIDTDEGDGYYFSGAVSSVSRLGDRIGLAFSLPTSYRNIEGAQVFTGGLEFALPIVLLKPGASRGIVWQVTPHVVGGAAASEDLAAGGLFFGYGGTSSLSIPLGKTAAITMGNGLYFYEGYPLNVGEYEFDTDLSQQVMKHGLKLTLGVGPAYVDVGATYTDFLQDAAVDNYVSPTLGIGTGAGTIGVRVAYQGDFADGYRSHGGTVSLYLNY